MKHLLKFVLLMGIMCLAGCSEDPQSVSFSIHELTVGPDAERLSITIEANCPWTVTDEKNKTFTEIREGSGTIETPFVVFTNPDTESKTYTVTVTSEDGTSSDVLTVYQAEQFGLEVGEAEFIAAEGGVIEIPISTNDDISDIETPDWITYTSSRGMTGYTYTFTAEPNKTGSPRQGEISFKGGKTSGRTYVEQDSYAPTGVVIEDIPYNTIESEVSIAYQLVPEYSDWRKIKVETSENTKAALSEGVLSLSMDEYGFHAFDITTKEPAEAGIDGNVVLLSAAIERFPEKIFYNSQKRELFAGEIISLKKNYDSEEYTMSSSDEGVAIIQDDGSIQALKKGKATIRISHPDLQIKDSIEVQVEPVRLSAWMDSYWDWGTLWTIYIAATIEGKNISKATFAIVDHGTGIVIPQGVVTKEYANGTNRVVYENQTSVFANNVYEMKERLEKINVEFTGIVDGEQITASTVVLPERP